MNGNASPSSFEEVDLNNNTVNNHDFDEPIYETLALPPISTTTKEKKKTDKSLRPGRLQLENFHFYLTMILI